MRTRAVTDVVVIGAGPAGVLAAIGAADLGVRTTLLSSAEFGDMAGTTAAMRVDLTCAAHSFPTYAEVLFYTAVSAADVLGLPLSGQAEQVAA